MKMSVLKWLPLAAAAWICCALHLPAQTAPTITTQPASQTNAMGTSATLSVAVSGSGPFSYQWQLNGANLPNTNFIITTVAGTNIAGYSGDGGAAIQATLSNPGGAAFDAGGNLYIADTSNQRIRKVDTNGMIATVAGTNSSGFSGDGGAAINAQLYAPSGVAFDAAGNLYIADAANNRIREVDTNGIITTIAGTNSQGYSGDSGAAVNAKLNGPSGVAFDAMGNLYIADFGNNRIRMVGTNGIITTVAGTGIPGFSGDGGAAINTELYCPSGVALDAVGNVYIADYHNSRIRKVDTNGNISTVAGTNIARYGGDGGPATQANLCGPEGVALDAARNLYIGDTYNYRIRKVDTNGVITTVAGTNNLGYSGDGGTATNAMLYRPYGVALDAIGNLYIADSGNNRIREVEFAGSPTLPLNNVSAYNAGSYTVVVTNAGGSVTSAVATLVVQAPPAIIVPPASQTVAGGGAAVLSVTAVGSGTLAYLWYVAGTNLVQNGTNYALSFPAVSATNAGNYTVVVTNAWGSATSQLATLRVQAPPAVTSQSTTQTVLPGTNVTLSVTAGGTGPFSYQWQFNGTTLPNTNAIITTVAGTNGVGYSGDGVAAGNATLGYPAGVAFDAAGNMYIADNGNSRIRKVDTNGIITTIAGTNSSGYSGDGGAAIKASLNSPNAVALDANGNVYIADASNGRIRKVATNGIITTFAGTNSTGYSGDGGAAINASLNAPEDVAVDSLGNLYIADHFNVRIRKVDTNGIITTFAGTNSAGYSGDGGAAVSAKLSQPSGVALDASGDLYIADTGNSRIRKVGTNGIITTVAGTNISGYAGDGGAAVNAELAAPVRVVMDASGDLYIADKGTNRIRKVDTNGIITTVAGTNSAGYSGDGGAALNAKLNGPWGMAFDAMGNLYIADNINSRIRKVLFSGLPTLSLSNVSAYNAGSYAVVISNAYGSVTGAVATLTVQAPPIITGQPASQLVPAGSSPTFSVAVAGSGPFGYLFYLAGTNLVQSGTNNALTLPAVSTNDPGNYTVVVTNAWGSATSQVATLTIVFPSSVPPGGLTVLAGSNASLSATVAGPGPASYQWQFDGTNLPNNIISTVAGNGTATYSGDGGPATNASLNFPMGLDMDAVGNLYVVDEYNNRIRKVDTNGIITTVAGRGPTYPAPGTYSGDGGPATNACLNLPMGVTVDACGRLYIADMLNSRIRKVETNGIITTVAGTNRAGYSGDSGAATSAQISYPDAVALDATGNLYIADTSNHRIRKVDTNGIITTVAGTNSAGYSGDGGPAANASLHQPIGLALDADGNLYIADTSNNRIRKVDTNGIITTVAGNGNTNYSGDGGAATNASLYHPLQPVLDAFGDLYIADDYNNRVRKVDTNGFISTVAGHGPSYPASGSYSGDGGAATNASLHDPFGLTFDAAGNLYFVDGSNQRIRKVLLYAGYPTLTLSNVLAGNAGSYSVVVSSPYGSVTSAVAALTVTIPTTAPQIVAGDGYCGFLTNQFGFNLSGAFGQTIVVDGSADLVHWTPLFTNTCGDGNPFYFCDPRWTNFAWRFYRARVP